MATVAKRAVRVFPKWSELFRTKPAHLLESTADHSTHLKRELGVVDLTAFGCSGRGRCRDLFDHR